MSDYGPQHEQIVALIERTRTLTREEAVALGVAWNAARDAAWRATWDAAWHSDRYAARGAALDADRRAARGAALDADRRAARGAAWDAAWDVAWDAAWGAACALVVRDLIGQYGFTQEHYDLLTGPWRTVVGPIHPDDKDLS